MIRLNSFFKLTPLIPVLMVLVVLSAFEELGNYLVNNRDDFNLVGEQVQPGVEFVSANDGYEVDNLTHSDK